MKSTGVALSDALQIPEDIYQSMIEHCQRESPLECCGILGGVSPRVLSIHPLRNGCQSETRYEADPSDVVAAVLALRERNAEILAIYHSHPRWPAVPSRTDLEMNYYGDVPRIIVSLLPPEPSMRVWRLLAESYDELGWQLVPPAVEPVTKTE
jgi:proteasome lid subunit RPN8/RPN11